MAGAHTPGSFARLPLLSLGPAEHQLVAGTECRLGKVWLHGYTLVTGVRKSKVDDE